MSFKRLLLSALAFFAFAGCSVYEGPPPVKTKAISQSKLGCMNDFAAELTDYFDGKSTPEDVNRLGKCAVTSLQTFGDLVRGEKRNQYTAAEVRDFLQRYFLKDTTISDGLLRELMRVKQALLGGKETNFTSDDLKEAEDLILTFRDIMLRLQPSMPLSVSRVKSQDVAFVEAEVKAIADVGDILGERITENDATYSFEDLGRLFDQVSVAFPGSAESLGFLRNHLKLAGVLKEALISPQTPRGTVTAAEWRLIFRDGARWTGTYLKFLNLQAKYGDWTRGEGRTRMSVIVNDSLDLLERVAARHCPKGDEISRAKGSRGPTCSVAPGIPFMLIQEVMQELDWDGSFGSTAFNKLTLENEIAPLIDHFFGGTDPGDTGRASIRLTAAHLERVRSLVRDWVDGSRYLEGVYRRALVAKDFGDDATVPTATIVKIDVRDVLRENGGVSESAMAIAKGLRDTIGATVSITAPGSSRALFDGKNNGRPRSYAELTRYTWLRPLLKAAVLGYMSGPDVATRSARADQDGLLLTEFTAMISDYWQILVDSKLVGPKNSPAGDAAKRFREAALFTQASNGDNLISVDEGVQLVLLTFSANPIGNAAHARIAKLCPTRGLDDYGEPNIEPKCFREKMFDFSSQNREMADLWAPFPVLVHFYDSLSAADRASFAQYLELSIRKAGKTPEDYFGSDDSGSIPQLFHYIESLFLRFDVNAANPTLIGDGFIDKREATVAFPSFRLTLAGLANLDPNDSKLESVFFYILANGSPPVDSSMGGWTKAWKDTQFLWYHYTAPDFKADRLHLLEVFATLSAPSGGAKPAAAKR
jgi:hypothetical protein